MYTQCFSLKNSTDLVFRPVGALALQHVDQVVGDRAGENFHMKTLLHRDIIVVFCCVAVIVFYIVSVFLHLTCDDGVTAETKKVQQRLSRSS